MWRGHVTRDGYLVSRAVRWLGRWPAATAQVPVIVILAGLAPAATTTSQAPSTVLCSGYASCTRLGYDSYGYASRGHASYWRMSAGDECTNYAAYVEATVFSAPTPRYALGNAGEWAASAAAHGVPVNRVPTVGSVAEWNPGSFGIGAQGHVAVVEKVGPHDSYILVSQQHISSDVNGYEWTRINAGFPGDRWQSWPNHFIHFPVKGHTSVGYYNVKTGSAAIRDTPSAGPANLAFRIAPPGMVPLAGDWSGHATASGYYDPRTGTFHLRDWLNSGKYRAPIAFGPPGMVPVVGDWTGKGRDRVGYYNPVDGSFHLRDYLSSGPASYTFTFGPPGMVPLVGSWSSKGADGIGYYDPRTAQFNLRTSLSSGPASTSFTFGPRGVVPLAGNWTGSKTSEIGFYNQRTGWFHLRAGLASGRVAYTFKFGAPAMVPLAANWLG